MYRENKDVVVVDVAVDIKLKFSGGFLFNIGCLTRVWIWRPIKWCFGTLPMELVVRRWRSTTSLVITRYLIIQKILITVKILFPSYEKIENVVSGSAGAKV